MINTEGLALIKQWEGFRAEAYLDGGGVWTVGYGHTSDENLKVSKGVSVTPEEAEELLREDISEASTAVGVYVTVPLTEHQRAALISFVFNVGINAFKSSTLLRLLNQGDYDAVPEQLLRWVFDNGKRVQGLANRRVAEGALWNRGSFVASAGVKAVTKPKPKTAFVTPQGIATVCGPLGGIFAALAGNDILTYGVLGVLVAATALGSYYTIRKINEEYAS